MLRPVIGVRRLAAAFLSANRLKFGEAQQVLSERATLGKCLCRDREHEGEIRFGQQGGRNEKTLRAKVLGGSLKKLYQLFSSFLRGASCPKSPRVAVTAAKLFMPEPTANVKGRLTPAESREPIGGGAT
jgi:hypothetical protein